MRRISLVSAAAALLAAVAPAEAQIFTPFGGPGMLTAPEAASGAIGAGAAHSAAQQQQCAQSLAGRGGLQTICPAGSPTPQPRR